MTTSIVSQLITQFSSGIFSEGAPTYSEVPTLPGWQGLLLAVGLITVLVLSLFWNSRAYQPPEIGEGHHDH